MENQKKPLFVGEVYTLLGQAGYPRLYVESMLPAWWSNSLLKTSSGALQFALFIKQRLGLEVEFNEDGQLSLKDEIISVRYKHRKGTDTGQLTVVKNLGKAATSILKNGVSEYIPLPKSPKQLRSYVLKKTEKSVLDFEALLDVCWLSGIPVLFLENIPRTARRMTGMVVDHNGQHSILLGLRDTLKARQLFILAHEIGHLLLGHVKKDSLLIDEDLDTAFDTLNDSILTTLDDEENEADQFALDLIRGELDLRFEEIGQLVNQLSWFYLPIRRGDSMELILGISFCLMPSPLMTGLLQISQ